MRGKRELAGLSGSNCSREYNKDAVLLAIAGQRNEKATVTLTVDLAGNRHKEENRQTKSAEFSLGTTVWIRGSHWGTDRTSQFAEGAKTNSQNGRYIRRTRKRSSEASERTLALKWVCAMSHLYHIPIMK